MIHRPLTLPVPPGTTLAQLRRLCGLSQHELARLIGRRQESLCRAERGHARTLRPSTVRALAEVLTGGDTQTVVLAFAATVAQAQTQAPVQGRQSGIVPA